MKLILKALLRYKTSTILNIIGLSTAFATFILIGMQVRYDLSYDKHNENYHSIYQLTLGSDGSDLLFSGLDKRQASVVLDNNISEVEYSSLVDRGLMPIYLDVNGEELEVNENLYSCGEDITRIFSFEFLSGDESSIGGIGNVIISDRFAKKWFGEQSPIGETIRVEGDVYTVTAVFESLPKNSTLQGDLFTKMSPAKENRGGNRLFCRVYNHADKKELDKKATDFLSKNVYAKIKANFVSLSDVRVVIAEYNKSTTIIFITIILFVLVLASINFVNFAVSMVPLKVKGINISRVVGASQVELRVSMVNEAIVLVLFSFCFALGLVELFKDSTFSYLITDSSFEVNFVVYILAFGVALLTGAISGLYPAFYATSFQPALVLKSSYALSASGARFRKMLIGFQFFISFIFITGTIFVHYQYDYMMNSDKGYNIENVILVKHPFQSSKHDIIKQELLKNSQIKDVTFTREAFGSNEYGGMYWDLKHPKGDVEITLSPVAHNFLDFFEIDIVEGRNFMLNDDITGSGYFVISKSLQDDYGFLVGEKIEGIIKEPTEMVGVCEDIQITNLKVKSKPFVLYVSSKSERMPYWNSYIKVADNSQNMIEYISEVYGRIDSELNIDVAYMTESFAYEYSEEIAFKNTIQAQSLITIIIALVGVFGLVSFDTRFRRKEIGLRKINGATVNNILTMFSFCYIRIVLISFVLSIPLVYYFVFHWLQQFPYKIDIYWWVFALALLMVLALTILISIVQSMRAAKENPVESIKSN